MLAYVFCSDWIHVMNYYSFTDVKSIYSKIHSVISHDHEVTYVFPFFCVVEVLVQIPVKSKSVLTDYS